MNILGISIQHDSGAAIIQDGRIRAAVNEERLNRKKIYWGFPALSIREVLRLSGLNNKDIDVIVLSNLFSSLNKIMTFDDLKGDRLHNLINTLSEIGVARILLGNNPAIRLARFCQKNILFYSGKLGSADSAIREIGLSAPITHIEHHNAHAASAYCTSGWDECLVITCDSVGDGYCSKIYLGRNGRLDLVHSVPFFNSPAPYYGYVTHICGFIEGRHEGKITGLAAYGRADKTQAIFKGEIDYDPKKLTFVNKGHYMLSEIKRLKTKLCGYKKEDIAAGIQAHLEYLVVSYIKDAIRRTGLKKVALAGGIFANVKLNQRILEIEGAEGIFIHPHMGDGGLAVGSALAYWLGHCKKTKKDFSAERLQDVYFGPTYTDSEIENALEKYDLKFYRPKNVAYEIAGLLAKNKVVARFEGKMEYGPRALGNRSILYRTGDVTVNDWLNKKLKRTEFMPFAPIILESDANDYFQNYDHRSSYAAQFMTITYNVTERCKKEAPAIVHIDGTARPQVVTEARNPDAANILRAYRELTGQRVLINTSFNMHEEPIVCSPDDAVRAFMLGHLDILAIGPYIVENKSDG